MSTGLRGSVLRGDFSLMIRKNTVRCPCKMPDTCAGAHTCARAHTCVHSLFDSFTVNLKYLFEFKCIMFKINVLLLTIKFYSYKISHTCFGKLSACKLPIAWPRS